MSKTYLDKTGVTYLVDKMQDYVQSSLASLIKIDESTGDIYITY